MRRVLVGVKGIGIAFLIAVLLMAVLELGLRAAGYGVSTHFLIRRAITGQDCYLPNREYFRQFFSLPMDSVHSWDTYEFQVPAKKGDRDFRIFVYGGSAANGAPPNCAYAFWRFLDAMLRTQFPSVHFEVYNVAVSGMNSSVMYPAAKACATLEPDAFVIYMGNNEMSGPFGARSWLTHQYTSSLAMIRAKVRTSNLRVAQLLEKLTPVSSSARAHIQDVNSWFASIDPATPEAQSVYRHYERNLNDMCKAAVSAEGAAIVCTVASNLVYWAPGGQEPPTLSGGQNEDYDAFYDHGTERYEADAFREAVEYYEKAYALYGGSAGLCYRLGYCHLQLGECEKAFDLLHRALDLDWCVVRSNRYVNEAVNRVATAWADKGVYFADAEKAVAEGCVCDVPGIDRFYDAVHLNEDGNYRIAACVFEQVKRLVAARFPDIETEGVAPPPQSQCELLIGMSPWVKYNHTVDTYKMHAAQPSTFVLRRCRALKDRSDGLRAQVGPDGMADTLDVYSAAIAQCEDDFYLRYGRVDFLVDRGDMAGALTETEDALKKLGPRRYLAKRRFELLPVSGNAEELPKATEKFLEWYPDDPEGICRYARLLEEQGKAEEAVEHYRKATFLNPSLGTAYESQGNLLEELGRTKEAREAYHRAVEAQPRQFERYGKLYEFMTEELPAAAEAEWRFFYKRFPNLALPRVYLAAALEQRGAVEEAAALYAEAEELDPESPATRWALAQVREAKGDYEGALEASEEALALDLRDLGAYERIDALLVRHVDPAARVEYWQDLTRVYPDLSQVFVKLGEASEGIGDTASAVDAYEKVLQLNPNDLIVKQHLDELNTKSR